MGSLSPGDFCRELVFIGLGVYGKSSDLETVSLGLSRSLLLLFRDAGLRVIRIQRYVDTTESALGSFCHAQLREYNVRLLELADTSVLTLSVTMRPYFAELKIMEQLVEMPAERLLDHVYELWQRKRLSSLFIELLYRALMHPFEERMTMEYLQRGGEFLSFEGVVPLAFASRADEIIRVKKTISVLNAMGEPVVSCEADVVCPHLVRVLLESYGGEISAKRLRMSLEGNGDGIENSNDEENDEIDRIHPWVRHFICTEENLRQYEAVGTFLKSLKSCQIRLSRSEWPKASGLGFRQKALHVLNALLSSIWLRLEQESWNEFSAKWRLCKHYEELIKNHNMYVERLFDVALQNQVSRPLLNAIQNLIRLANHFVDFGHLESIECDFDANIALFQQIANGILAQRKIGFLKALIEAIAYYPNN